MIAAPCFLFLCGAAGGDSPRKMAYSCSLPVRNAAMHRAKASALLHPICPHCLGCKFGGSRTETAKSIRLSSGVWPHSRRLRRNWMPQGKLPKRANAGSPNRIRRIHKKPCAVRLSNCASGKGEPRNPAKAPAAYGWPKTARAPRLRGTPCRQRRYQKSTLVS